MKLTNPEGDKLCAKYFEADMVWKDENTNAEVEWKCVCNEAPSFPFYYFWRQLSNGDNRLRVSSVFAQSQL